MSNLPPPELHPEEHAAPMEPHPLPKPAWQRWREWSGSNFIISLLLHIVVIAVAAFLVVQVMQPREKPKFKSAPPSPNPPSEHQVKAAKLKSMTQPTISKRITTTAANASIALPAMEMNAAMPDMMSSVMSNLGASGLGAGASGGMGAMPPGGMTAFGFHGTGVGLKGHFYDLKQTPDRKASDLMKGGPKTWNANHISFLNDFFQKGWDESMLQKYYQARDSMVALQVFVPRLPSPEGPKAFGVEKEVPQGSHWVVLYKGTVEAPKDGTYRFIGLADDVMAVRFNRQNVFAATTEWEDLRKTFPDLYTEANETMARGAAWDVLDGEKRGGEWFQVQRGKIYPIEILISEVPGGLSGFLLLIQELRPDVPYPHRNDKKNYLAYPVFQVKKGAPIPPGGPEVAPDPVVFTAK